MADLRAAGWLLTIGGLIAIAAACTPPYKQWYAPLPEAMQTIAEHPIAWRVINGGFLVGTIVAALGFAALTVGARARSGETFALLGSVAFGVGTLFWVLNLVHRMSVQSWAAAEFVANGSIPGFFFPQQTQAAFHFGLFAVFAFGGVALAGWSVLTNMIAPRWVGHTMLWVGIIGAPIVTFIGPWVLYVPIVILGVAILVA